MINEVLELDCRECYRTRTARAIERLRVGQSMNVVSVGMVTAGELLMELVLWMRCGMLVLHVERLSAELLRCVLAVMADTCHVQESEGDEKVWVDRPLVKGVRIYTPKFCVEDYGFEVATKLARLVKEGRVQVLETNVQMELMMLKECEHPRVRGESGLLLQGELPQKRTEERKVKKLVMSKV